ncbi:MAG: exo-alpha-sialidase [Haliscomenobacter sp.]|nr:exo-alpha-sialidase [Haliscomenobacter sp.]
MKNLMYALGWIALLVLSSSFECTEEALAPPTGTIAVSASSPDIPVLRGLAINPLIKLTIAIPEAAGETRFRQVMGTLGAEGLKDIQQIDLYLAGPDTLPSGNPLGSVSPAGTSFTLPFDVAFAPGIHYLWVSVQLKPETRLDRAIEIHGAKLTDEKGKTHKIQETEGRFVKRQGVAIRKAGEGGVDTYRIPGLVQTDKGTLIAVYDIRYDNSRDLPGNIDVGMSRSTDGGNTWEPMKNIMDMGPPHENNGIGDPTILFDPATRKIWVAALWSKGNRSIAGSGPGLTPDETGQFVLVSSNDDGLTWSAPYSITAQIKDPKWKIFFQGPGNGIAMADGKLVFPAQYWDPTGMPFSNIIYSQDHGTTWQSSKAAPKSNTTESQVVETMPGVLMLNMRDNRGKFRSVATTSDMGATWKEHPTSYSALPDPVCMGSLIKARVKIKGALREVLFFSNPNTSSGRYNITVKASLDLGESWSPEHQLLIDQRKCYGYSSLTAMDENTIGLLYEGTKELYFVKIPVREVIGE